MCWNSVDLPAINGLVMPISLENSKGLSATMFLLLYLAGFAAMTLLAFIVFPWLTPASAQSRVAMTDNSWDAKEDSTDLPLSINFIVQFASGPGADVFGWPSRGGIYVLSPCFGVELDFLELDRFCDKSRPPTSDADFKSDEEVHCDRSKSIFPE